MTASPLLVVGSVAFDTLHLPTGSHPKIRDSHLPHFSRSPMLAGDG